jgi:ATP-dependent DNA ligase
VKQARTLDLVVLAAEWGSGRRRGTLSNLHLGARDAERGGFVMLGKTFKGLTDEMLAWQTKKFLELESAAMSTPSTCGRRSSWRSRSTKCRQARNIPAA